MWRDFLELFFPKICFACGESLVYQEHIMCIHCELHLPRVYFSKYGTENIEQIFYGRFYFDKAISYYYFKKGSHVQQLLHHLKYKGHPEIGDYCGKLLAKEMIQTHLVDFDFIIPVPLHQKKQKQRGYNQAETIANGIAQVLNIQVKNLVLERTHYTTSQTTKSRDERLENIKNAFSIKNKELISDKKILLVDDVITTGATIEACANILLENKVKSVSIASLAVAKY